MRRSSFVLSVAAALLIVVSLPAGATTVVLDEDFEAGTPGFFVPYSCSFDPYGISPTLGDVLPNPHGAGHVYRLQEAGPNDVIVSPGSSGDFTFSFRFYSEPGFPHPTYYTGGMPGVSFGVDPATGAGYRLDGDYLFYFDDNCQQTLIDVSNWPLMTSGWHDMVVEVDNKQTHSKIKIKRDGQLLFNVNGSHAPDSVVGWVGLAEMNGGVIYVDDLVLTTR